MRFYPLKGLLKPKINLNACVDIVENSNENFAGLNKCDMKNKNQIWTTMKSKPSTTTTTTTTTNRIITTTTPTTSVESKSYDAFYVRCSCR